MFDSVLGRCKRRVWGGGEEESKRGWMEDSRMKGLFYVMSVLFQSFFSSRSLRFTVQSICLLFGECERFRPTLDSDKLLFSL